MFDSFKQLKQLKELQSAIQKEEVTAERDGVRVTMNGAFEVSAVTITGEIANEKLEKILKEVFNDAVKNAQQAIAQKFASMQQK
jgi:DNA-binding protein YbaB